MPKKISYHITTYCKTLKTIYIMTQGGDNYLKVYDTECYSNRTLQKQHEPEIRVPYMIVFDYRL